MLSLRMEIVKRRGDMKGFVVLPRRWVVERTFSCGFESGQWLLIIRKRKFWGQVLASVATSGDSMGEAENNDKLTYCYCIL